MGSKMFQSTPAIADGRTDAGRGEAAGREVFQSTPAIADGRTAIAWGIKQYDKAFQSTPAIADGRTSQLVIGQQQLVGFNPRPPSLTGEPHLLRSRYRPR